MDVNAVEPLSIDSLNFPASRLRLVMDEEAPTISKLHLDLT